MTAASATNTLRRPAQSDSLPAIGDVTTIAADWTSVPRKIWCGTSSSAVPSCSRR